MSRKNFSRRLLSLGLANVVRFAADSVTKSAYPEKLDT